MIETKSISSLDELLAYAVAVHRGDEPFLPISIHTGSLTFSLRVCGTGWDERIDSRLARYVIDLQAAAEDLLTECGIDKVGEEKPQVKATLRKGSSEIVPDLIEIIKAIVMSLTPDQKFTTIMSAIAAMMATPMVLRWLDKRAEKQALTEHETTKRDLFRAISEMAVSSGSPQMAYEKPIRTFVTRGIKAEDSISIAGETLPADEARRLFPRQKRTDTSTSYADGEYQLLAISYTADDQPVMQLSRDGIELKAYTSQLSDEDADSLFMDIFTRQKSEALPLAMDLQMNVHHTARRIKHGSVVGIGAPRPGKEHLSLTSITTP